MVQTSRVGLFAAPLSLQLALSRLFSALALFFTCTLFVYHRRSIGRIGRTWQTTTALSMVSLFLAIITLSILFVLTLGLETTGAYNGMQKTLCESYILSITCLYTFMKCLFNIFFTYRIKLAFADSFLKASTWFLAILRVISVIALVFVIYLMLFADSTSFVSHQGGNYGNERREIYLSIPYNKETKNGTYIHCRFNWHIYSIVFLVLYHLLSCATLLVIFTRKLLTTTELLGDISTVSDHDHNQNIVNALRKHTIIIIGHFLSMFVCLTLILLFEMYPVFLSMDLLISQLVLTLVFSFNKDHFRRYCFCAAKWITPVRMKRLTMHRSPQWLVEMNNRLNDLHEAQRSRGSSLRSDDSLGMSPGSGLDPDGPIGRGGTDFLKVNQLSPHSLLESSDNKGHRLMHSDLTSINRSKKQRNYKLERQKAKNQRAIAFAGAAALANERNAKKRAASIAKMEEERRERASTAASERQAQIEAGGIRVNLKPVSSVSSMGTRVVNNDSMIEIPQFNANADSVMDAVDNDDENDSDEDDESTPALGKETGLATGILVENDNDPGNGSSSSSQLDIDDVLASVPTETPVRKLVSEDGQVIPAGMAVENMRSLSDNADNLKAVKKEIRREMREARMKRAQKKRRSDASGMASIRKQKRAMEETQNGARASENAIAMRKNLELVRKESKKSKKKKKKRDSKKKKKIGWHIPHFGKSNHGSSGSRQSEKLMNRGDVMRQVLGAGSMRVIPKKHRTMTTEEHASQSKKFHSRGRSLGGSMIDSDGKLYDLWVNGTNEMGIPVVTKELHVEPDDKGDEKGGDIQGTELPDPKRLEALRIRSMSGGDGDDDGHGSSGTDSSSSSSHSHSHSDENDDSDKNGMNLAMNLASVSAD